MRVVTWNLQHGVPDPKGPPALDLGLDPLAALGGDAVALQELDRNLERTGHADQAQVIADHVGAQVLWAPAISRRGGSYGNALLTRGELADAQVLALPGSREPRSAGLADVTVDDVRWSIATCHLSLDHDVARRQLLAVFDAMARRRPPRVILGDLNLVPRFVLPSSTAEGYHLVTGPPTVNARARPTRRLDHLLVQGCRVLRAGTAKLPLSDHLAVWADLER